MKKRTQKRNRLPRQAAELSLFDQVYVSFTARPKGWF